MFNNVKHPEVIYIKSGDKFFTQLIMIGLESKDSRKYTFILSLVFGICCRHHNLIYFNSARSVSQRNSAPI